MVVYFMGFQLCIGYIQSIFSSLNTLYEDQLFLHNLFLFLDLRPGIPEPEHPRPFPGPFKNEIRLENVTFAYTGSRVPALRNVSLSLHRGEVIALVGGNGAGKSTLVKILCRLYAPGSGRILVDGEDAAGISTEDWQRQITVLFQDYVRYFMTAGENIRVADIRRPPGSPEILQASQKSGADSVISRLPDGYGTVLGSSFTGGTDLSTGEWQKIALARAFFRNADIVILDEPASSLDALAEADIFRKFREIVDGRSAILISHRFSTVLMADHIYVLDQGAIVEHGSHADLMALGGRYAAMFCAQAKAYQDSPP